MWRTLATFIFLSPSSHCIAINSSLFGDEHKIFSCPYNITKIRVQSEDERNVRSQTEFASIFFTAVDERFDGGSCIFVLENLAAYEILEGGRDTTIDYSNGPIVYFGSKDGVYKYDKETLSTQKFGYFSDDIIQLQKANGTDTIYYLTSKNTLFALEYEGKVKRNVAPIVCATQFVLDTSNNLYYVQCKTQFIFILKPNSFIPTHVPQIFSDVTLISPASIMDSCIPILGDGLLLIIYMNGTSASKDFYVQEKPSAISVDTALNLVAVAVKGKIYVYNMMKLLLKYSAETEFPQQINKFFDSVLDFAK